MPASRLSHSIVWRRTLAGIDHVRLSVARYRVPPRERDSASLRRRWTQVKSSGKRVVRRNCAGVSVRLNLRPCDFVSLLDPLTPAGDAQCPYFDSRSDHGEGAVVHTAMPSDVPIVCMLHSRWPLSGGPPGGAGSARHCTQTETPSPTPRGSVGGPLCTPSRLAFGVHHARRWSPVADAASQRGAVALRGTGA